MLTRLDCPSLLSPSLCLSVCQVVGVGSNPAWSFSPAVDLFDQQTTGRLDTPKLVPNNNSNASQAAASPNAAAGASAKPAATSLDAVFAKFGVGRTTTAAAGAATSGSTPASASVVSAVAAPVNLDAISSRNVLIIGAGDILHAFKTLVLQHRRTKKGEAPEPMHVSGDSCQRLERIVLPSIVTGLADGRFLLSSALSFTSSTVWPVRPRGISSCWRSPSTSHSACAVSHARRA